MSGPPGHDRRYAIDPSKVETELSWRPKHSFEAALRRTVQWYLANEVWCERVRSGEYRQWTMIASRDQASRYPIKEGFVSRSRLVGACFRAFVRTTNR